MSAPLLSVVPPAPTGCRRHDPKGAALAWYAAKSGELDGLSDLALSELFDDWSFWARPAQLPPPEPWRFWLIRTGRGWGKTLTASQWLQMEVDRREASIFGLFGESDDAIRDVMVDGPTGILATFPRHKRPRWIKTDKVLEFHTGAKGYAISAETPEKPRGFNFGRGWMDEPAKCANLDEYWKNIRFALREDSRARCVITGTPRPLPFFYSLERNPLCVLTRGSMYDNTALPKSFVQDIEAEYEGTRDGLEEIHGELTEVAGASFKMADIKRLGAGVTPAIVRAVVGVDPAQATGRGNDPTGIVGAGRGAGDRPDAFVLADRTAVYGPEQWANAAIDLYLEIRADLMVCERNRGGDMVGAVVRAAAKERGIRINFRDTYTSWGKGVQAAPIARFYQKGRVFHVENREDPDHLNALETEMTTWVPPAPGRKKMRSPNRRDAMVIAVGELLGGGSRSKGLASRRDRILPSRG